MGWNEMMKMVQSERMELLQPALDFINETSGNGTVVIPTEDGKGFRATNNFQWYSKWSKEHNYRAMTKADKEELAEEMVRGNAQIGDFRGPVEAFAESGRKLDEINGKIKALDEIKDKMKELNGVEMRLTEGLTKEGFSVYRAKYEQLKNAPGFASRGARMDAIIYARRADIYAKLMREKGNANYTAKDYMERNIIQFGGQTVGGFNQGMYQSKIDNIEKAYDEALQINKDKQSKNNKPYYHLQGSKGNYFDIPATEIVHDINDHGLTKEQAIAIINGSEDFIYTYQDMKSRGYHGGIAVLCKINTSLGHAGIMYEFMPNGRVFVGTMFFDTDAEIDNWAKKGGSSVMISENSETLSHWQPPLSISTIQDKLGIVKFNQLGAAAKNQMAEIRKQYEGTDQWMKAPNGKDTNLSEEQWLAVRTPAFKEWFGDWEMYSKAIPAFDDDTVEVAKQTIEKYRKTIFVSANSMVDAQISKAGRSKLISGEAVRKSMENGFTLQDHLLAVNNIKQLFENSILSYTGEDKNKEIKAKENFSAPILLKSGELALATFTVKVVNNTKTGRSIYSIEVMELKKSEGNLPSQVKKTDSATSDLVDLNISQIADKINMSSKVVDENGEPLVVYHGSDNNFDVFDASKNRSSMDIQGSFFSPWSEDAMGYGNNVRAFFLNIKNPAKSAKGYKALNTYKGQKEAGIKARDLLAKQGFDGVNNDNEEYIVFESNQ
ncbi:MAG: hypothetical protein K6C05_03755, partial [Anaerovibrio sp.]|nr:hypothetical protein [Anaerovibrio sp.]